MLSRKAQSGLEFLILFGFLMVAFSGFFVIAHNKTVEINKLQKTSELREITDFFKKEVLLAEEVHSGYERTFSLPGTVSGTDYRIKDYAGNKGYTREFEFSSEQGRFFVFLHKNITIPDSGDVLYDSAEDDSARFTIKKNATGLYLYNQ